MAKFHRGRIEIPLKLVEKPNGNYHIGEWGDAELKLDLSAVKILIFPAKGRPGDLTMIIDDKNKKENGDV